MKVDLNDQQGELNITAANKVDIDGGWKAITSFFLVLQFNFFQNI